MSDQIRVAVLGMGSVARAVHLPILTRRTDKFEIAAICDLSLDSVNVAGDRFGIEQRFDDLDTMLDSVDVDALMVLTSGSHTGQVLAGLRRDLPVFCEKPVAYTLRETDLIDAELAGRSDRLMIGYMKIYDPAVVQAKKLLTGRRARAIEVVVLHPSSESQLATSELDPISIALPSTIARRLEGESNDLATEALGDAADSLGQLYTGVLLGSLVHDLAVLRFLGVEMSHIDFAERWPPGSSNFSVAVHGRSMGTQPNGDDLRVSMNWHLLPDYPLYREEIRWHDDSGSIELSFPSPYLLRVPTKLISSASKGSGLAATSYQSHVGAFEEEMLAFHHMVTMGVQPADGLFEGRSDIRTCQQIVAKIAEKEDLSLGGESLKSTKSE